VDLAGKFQVQTLRKNSYVLIMVDDKSRLVMTRLLPRKNKQVMAIKELHAWSQTQSGNTFKSIRCDGELPQYGEFMTFSKEKGIELKVTTRGSSNQNPVAESTIKTICTLARTMLLDSKLPRTFYGYALEAATHLYNRLPHDSNGGKSPYELFYGRRPPTDHLRRFGSKAYVLKHKQSQVGKSQTRADSGILIGYDAARRAYKVLVPPRRIIVSRDVQFDESDSALRGGESTLNEEDYSDETSLHAETTNDTKGETSQSGQGLEIELDEDIESHGTADNVTVDQEGDSSSDDLTASLQDEEGDKSPESSKQTLALRKLDIGGRGTYWEPPTGSRRPTRELKIATRAAQKMQEAAQKMQDGATSAHEFSPGVSTHPDEVSSQLASAFGARHVISDKKAASMPKYRTARNEEFKKMKLFNAFELVDLPTGEEALGSTMVYTDKVINGKEKIKARWCIQGFKQQRGFDYFNTWAPTMQKQSLRILIARSAMKGSKLRAIDTSSAFLHSSLSETIYVKPPAGYPGAEGKVALLKKAVYGLKQAGAAWHAHYSAVFKKIGLQPIISDPAVFVGKILDEDFAIGCHVDDGIAEYETKAQFDFFLKEAQKELKMRDEGPLAHILGCEVTSDAQFMYLSQGKYTLKILEEFGFDKCNPAKTPATATMTPSAPNSVSQLKKFGLNKICGSLIWLTTNTRPDIAFSVSKLGQELKNPTDKSFTMAARILRYLRKTHNYGLRYPKKQLKRSEMKLSGYVDADFAGDLNDRKSQYGYLFFLGDCLIDWGSWKMRMVTLSSAESELVGAVEAGKTAKWLRQLLKEILVEQTAATVIYEDNAGTIFLSETTCFSRRTRHIDVRYHFLNEVVHRGLIKLKKVASNDNLADIMTKALSPVKFIPLSGKVVHAVDKRE